MKKALITGIFGQDGGFLLELLADLGYEVHGVVRQKLSDNSSRIKEELESNGYIPFVHVVDVCNYNELKDLICELQPDEIYHLAAVHVSSEWNSQTSGIFYDKELFDRNVLATSNILSVCWNYLKNAKLVFAGSCLMFDNSRTKIQTEKTPFNSKSLYGLAKITENALVKYYRSKGLHCSTAILYNHESHRRSIDFVTKKIVSNMVKILRGEINTFSLGNISTQKDWGYAKEYVEAMCLMAQAKVADDYIISSGTLHSIKDFIDICANKLKIDDWEKHVKIDPQIISRKLSSQLLGSNLKIQKKLDWKPLVNLERLIEIMIDHEIKYACSK